MCGTCVGWGVCQRGGEGHRRVNSVCECQVVTVCGFGLRGCWGVVSVYGSTTPRTRGCQPGVISSWGREEVLCESTRPCATGLCV